jgi:hypothetical protein
MFAWAHAIEIRSAVSDMKRADGQAAPPSYEGTFISAMPVENWIENIFACYRKYIVIVYTSNIV